MPRRPPKRIRGPLLAVARRSTRAPEAPDRLQVRAVQHVNLTIPRGGETEARAFYTEVLSLAEIPKPEVVRANGGLWYRVGELELHLSVEEGGRTPSRRHVGFVVGDLERARRFFQAHGIATLPQADLPGWSRFYVHDPFGNRLEIQSPRRRTRG